MDETQVKKLLSSLIISSPKSITIRELNQDYQSQVGKDIPYITFGFSSLEAYLRSIPDVCRISGSGLYALVEPVVNEKVKHINDMVLKQKLTKNNKRVPVYRRSRGIVNNSIENASCEDVNGAVSLNDNMKDISGLSNWECGHEINTVKIDPFKNILQHLHKLHINKKINNSVDKCVSEITSTSNSNNIEYSSNSSFKYYDDDDQWSNDDDFDDLEVFSKNSEEFQFDTDIQKNPVKAEEMKENIFQIPDYVSKRVSNSVKNNLRILISEKPEGIWCSELSRMYRERFKEELDMYEFDFGSMSELCENLTDVFHMVRPGTTDWKVFDKSKPKPDASKIDDFLPPIQLIAEENVHFEDEYPNEDNIFQVDSDNLEDSSSEFPDDVLAPGAVIEAQWLSEDTTLLSLIEIIVVEIYNPTQFYIQLRSLKPIRDKFIDDMQLFYKVRQKEFQMKESLVRVGLYCCAYFLNEFHRAIIIQIFSENTYKVFSIDYGTVVILDIGDLFFLHETFCTLPHQAIKAQLSGVVPKNGKWSRKSAERFLELVKEKDLVASIIKIDYLTFTLSLIITDVTLPYDIHINDVLLDDGFAEIQKNLH